MNDLRNTTIAAIAIFAGLVLWKSHSHKTEADPIVQNTARAQDILKHNFQNGQTDSIDNLRSAYTGSWAKNHVVQQPDNTYSFQQPTAALQKHIPAIVKKDNKKKAKKVAKKTRTKYRYYTGPHYQNTFKYDGDDKIAGPQPAGIFSQNNNPTPSAGGGNIEKKLSAKEYLEKILATKKIDFLVKDYKSHDTDAKTFYAVMDSLLAPTQTDPRVRLLAYQAMGDIPTNAQSFIEIAKHVNQEAATVQPTARQDLQAYATIYQMTQLNTVITTNSESSVRIVAAQIVQTVAQQIYSNSSSGSGGHGGLVYTEQVREQYFGPLHNTLTRLLSAGNLDAQVASAFTNANNAISRLINS